MDACSTDDVNGDRSAEQILLRSWGGEGSWGGATWQRHEEADTQNLRAVRDLLDGVRKHGTYKKYRRAPHREVLACRSLAMRGYLAPKGTRRTRGAQKWKAAVAFLAKQGDNGIVWTVLSYWRATE